MVLGVIFIDIMSPSSGLVNRLLNSMSIDSFFFLGDTRWFPFTMILTETWKSFGYGTIVYLAAITGIDPSLYEAAFIDGAGHWTILWKIYVPVSMPALATILLFAPVHHWNSCFDGLILMNNPDNYPLQSYIQTIVVQRSYSMLSREEIQQLATISDKTLRSAQIFLGSLPIVAVYPFLQKYFVNSIMLGGVKGLFLTLLS